MKRTILNSTAIFVFFIFLFSSITPSVYALAPDQGKLPRDAGTHPGALSALFEGPIYNDYNNVIGIIKNALPGSTIYTPVYTVREDTSIDGDDNNRTPRLDIFEDSGVQIRIPRGKRDDLDKLPFEYMVIPLIIPKGAISGKLASLLSGKKSEKEITDAVIKYLEENFTARVNIVDEQKRTHQLDVAGVGNIAWDKLSTIAVMAQSGDILVQIPFWIRYDEFAMQRVLKGQDIGHIEPPVVSTVDWAKDIDVSTHEKALDFLSKNAWQFFREFSSGDYTHVDLLMEIISRIDVSRLIVPKGIVYDPVLGVFRSEDDRDAKVPGFDKNLERFLAGLNTVQQLAQLLYLLSAPGYENHRAIAIVNPALQDAIIGFYYDVYSYLDKIAIENFNDPTVFEPMRMEIGRFADAINDAIRERQVLPLNGSVRPESVFMYLEQKGISFSEAEKAAINRLYELYESRGEGGSWLYDILQLGEVISRENFIKVFRYVTVGMPRSVSPNEIPSEVIDGTGRIATMELALRLNSDIFSADKRGYFGRYGLRTRELKGTTTPEEKLQSALGIVREMFSDSVVKASGLGISTYLEEDRLTFRAGNTALEAIQDFKVGEPVRSVYPVDIFYDGDVFGRVYVIDVGEFVGERKGIPRPFIVKDGEEEVVFNLLLDATPGGVYIGDGVMERLLEEKEYKKGTAWQLAGVAILPKSGLATLRRLAEAITDEMYTRYNRLREAVDIINQGSSAVEIMNRLTEEQKGLIKVVVKKEKLAKILLGDAREELERLEELLSQIESERLEDRQIPFDYYKAQIAEKLRLVLSGGFHFMGRYIHKLPKVKETGASYYTPTSCSTNGASYFGLTLSTLLGLGIQLNTMMGITFHMYTSGKDAEETYGHLSSQTTGAAQGVSQHFRVNAFFTALRTPTGLKDGQTDIVGGSSFYFLIQTPYPVDRDVVVRFLERVADEHPEVLQIFRASDKENGRYTWKKTINGQMTGSIIYEDQIKQIAPDTFVAVVAYDNEMSFAFQEYEVEEARWLALKRQKDKRRRYLSGILAKASADIRGNEKVPLDFNEGVLREVGSTTGIIVKEFVNPDTNKREYGEGGVWTLRQFANRINSLIRYFSSGMDRIINRIGILFRRMPENTVFMVRGDKVLFNAEVIKDGESARLEEEKLYQTVRVNSSAIGIAKTLRELSKRNPNAKVVIYSPEFTDYQLRAILDAIDTGGFSNVSVFKGDAAAAYNGLQDKEKKKVVVADIEKHDGLNIPQVIVREAEEGRTLHHMPFFNLLAIMSNYASLELQAEEILSLYRLWLSLPENGYGPDEIEVILAELSSGLTLDTPAIPLPPLPKAESLLKQLDAQYASGIETYA